MHEDRPDLLAVDGLGRRSPAMPDQAGGSYRWRGELRLWDNEALMGWYRSTDAAVRSNFLSRRSHEVADRHADSAGDPADGCLASLDR